MKHLITRAYNTITPDNTNGTLVKKSKEARLKTELEFYQKIQKYGTLGLWFPRLVEESTNNLRIEHYAYDNLGNLMINEEFDADLWGKIIDQLKNASSAFSQFHQHIYNSRRQMYIEKTLKYYYELLGKFKKFRSIANYKYIKINGTEYENFDYIWPRVEKIINERAGGDTPAQPFKSCIIHGDLCFSNILYGKTKTGDVVLKFVDPRGSFGTDGIFGDPLYDVAKLRHSFEGGYEYIIYDKFWVSQGPTDDGSFELRFDNDNKDRIRELFLADEAFNDPLANLIQGLIFIGMCSRHYDSAPRQIAMYLTGVRLLNESLREIGS